MNDTTVTVMGNVALEPRMRVTSGGARVTSFRLAVNERRFIKELNTWRDGETMWFTVSAWRTLAENVHDSVFKGQPVVVHGRLRVRIYDDKEGQQRTSVEIDAISVGHDLTRGTSAFQKMPPGLSVERQMAAELAAELDEEAAVQPVEAGADARSLVAVGWDGAGTAPGADESGSYAAGWGESAAAETGAHDHTAA